MVVWLRRDSPAESGAKPEPKVAENKQEPAKGEPKVVAKQPTTPKAFTNTLGMKFVPVPGTEVSFCIWETRVKDYATYAEANEGVDGEWKSPGFKQEDTHPVANVSWNDAQALAAGKIKAGQRYRLPTDAEWSVAVGLGKEPGISSQRETHGDQRCSPMGQGMASAKGGRKLWAKFGRERQSSQGGRFSGNLSGGELCR